MTTMETMAMAIVVATTAPTLGTAAMQTMFASSTSPPLQNSQATNVQRMTPGERMATTTPKQPSMARAMGLAFLTSPGQNKHTKPAILTAVFMTSTTTTAGATIQITKGHNLT